ncbi:hypothetical protein ACIQD3_15135 [Peribacillus loiseleuriae]|uniref:hypothetical protein n=1 Tax=Peribacillus loiseleuriae TaxID=1679170 RepID=UPI00381520E8
MQFLIKEKGYPKDDILKVESKIDPKGSDKTASSYVVEVMFSDEPTIFYMYRVEDRKVYQFGHSGSATKHVDLAK